MVGLNVKEIDEGDFYCFEKDLMKDHEILENILNHTFLREVIVSGWNFVSSLDNIKLIAE